eukprot:Amastigsp_a761_82.p5 type:complete len:149 gc:universal Amastigsp_a761_82:243-689(+)
MATIAGLSLREKHGEPLHFLLRLGFCERLFRLRRRLWQAAACVAPEGTRRLMIRPRSACVSLSIGRSGSGVVIREQSKRWVADRGGWSPSVVIGLRRWGPWMALRRLQLRLAPRVRRLRLPLWLRLRKTLPSPRAPRHASATCRQGES